MADIHANLSQLVKENQAIGNSLTSLACEDVGSTIEDRLPEMVGFRELMVLEVDNKIGNVKVDVKDEEIGGNQKDGIDVNQMLDKLPRRTAGD